VGKGVTPRVGPLGDRYVGRHEVGYEGFLTCEYTHFAICNELDTPQRSLGELTTAKDTTKASKDKTQAEMVSHDADRDVDITVAHSVDEFVRAPRMTEWSQSGSVEYVRDRRQYEEKNRERCAVTGEVFENVIVSIKTSFTPRLLEHVARYVVKKDVFDITEDDLRWQIGRKAGSMLNNHVPDVDQLFANHLRMDLKEPDNEA
jgi:hypothetical protein